jgi:hypothetical protein
LKKLLANPMFAIAIVPAFALLMTLLLGLRSGAIIMLFWPLWLAYRFDNQSGTFLVLTMLLYIVIAILVTMLMLMVVTH